MKKLFLFVTLALISFIDTAFGGQIDPLLAHKWDLEGSTVTFGQDNSYDDDRHDAYGRYVVNQALSGSADSKKGNINLTITKASSTSWPAATYNNCPVTWGRSDMLESQASTETVQAPDPNDPTKTISVQKTVYKDVKVGDLYSLTVTCDPGVLVLTRQEKLTGGGPVAAR